MSNGFTESKPRLEYRTVDYEKENGEENEVDHLPDIGGGREGSFSGWE
jgi:hypothetical protein